MRLDHPGSVAQWCLFVRSWHFGSCLATTWAIGPKDRDSTPKRAGQDWGAEDSCNLAEMWILDTEEEWGARPNYTIYHIIYHVIPKRSTWPQLPEPEVVRTSEHHIVLASRSPCRLCSCGKMILCVWFRLFRPCPILSLHRFTRQIPSRSMEILTMRPLWS